MFRRNPEFGKPLSRRAGRAIVPAPRPRLWFQPLPAAAESTDPSEYVPGERVAAPHLGRGPA
jgi:hypothetical protein